MKISQLQPGHKILEHRDSGEIIHYEVVSVAPVGKMFEVTFRTVSGLTTALYPANGFITAAA
ncbi:MAG: hypothetical protein JO171_16750 [Paludibacterium sp.]|uniref:hypothetical protein n=1 Tax=Paludibacterium sp. TaxID=1917523 RepID=UPI0025EF9588|nr:hypothetical protein [Paludibacterium sp.]MBV8048800.1 hypothetical protein [Paludibacterium sp.]MBV8645910.1 hypothetical protein [Paludibacterium sp.]